MNCGVCGGGMEFVRTDLPFKTGDHSIVVFRDLPVWQCRSCPEYLLEDSIMGQIEEVLAKRDSRTEIEVVRLAA